MKRETPRGSNLPYRNRVGRCITAAVFLLLMPVLIYAQPWQGQSGPPPIAAPLVREGDLASKLMPALGLGPASDEVMAESRLIGVDIQPRNGWIGDYPVTPDIVDELVKSVGEAADSGRLLPMGRDEALRRLTDVFYGAGLAAAPGASGPGYGAADSDASGLLPGYRRAGQLL